MLQEELLGHVIVVYDVKVTEFKGNLQLASTATTHVTLSLPQSDAWLPEQMENLRATPAQVAFSFVIEASAAKSLNHFLDQPLGSSVPYVARVKVQNFMSHSFTGCAVCGARVQRSFLSAASATPCGTCGDTSEAVSKEYSSLVLVDGPCSLRGKAWGGAHQVLKQIQNDTVIVKLAVRITNGEPEAIVHEAMRA